MRHADIEALLNRADQDIAGLSEAVEVRHLDRIRVKNTLENLRSALDYLAQDVLARLKVVSPREKLPERAYFPYGQRQNHFRLSVQRNLPTLSRDLPAVYAAIVRRQPFSSGDTWLVDLCKLTNEAKHDRLHEPEAHRSQTLTVPGAFRVSGKDVLVYGNFVNGLPADDVFVKDGVVDALRKQTVPVNISEDNKIVFLGKQLEVVPFLSLTSQELRDMIAEVQALL